MSCSLIDFLVSTAATLFSALIAVAALAQIKAVRLQMELRHYAEIIRELHGMRQAGVIAPETTKQLDSAIKQLETIKEEVQRASEGALALSFGLKMRLKAIVATTDQLLQGRTAANIMQLLDRDGAAEERYRAMIQDAERKAEALAAELWFGSLLIP